MTAACTQVDPAEVGVSADYLANIDALQRRCLAENAYQGSVVLMATDLGIGRPDPFQWPMVAGEWLAFSHRVKDSACHLRTLVPYSASRWPHSLGAALAAQEWSPRSTAGHLRRTLQVLISHEAQQAHVVSQ